MSGTATLSTTFKLTIPKAIRDAQAWSVGQELAFIPKGRGVLILPVPHRHELRGIARGARAENYRDRSERTIEIPVRGACPGGLA